MATKHEMIKRISSEMDITQKDTKSLFDAFFLELEKVLTEGMGYTEYGFGTFFTEEDSPRNGFNPATRQKMILPRRTKVRFRPSDVLKVGINE